MSPFLSLLLRRLLLLWALFVANVLIASVSWGYDAHPQTSTVYYGGSLLAFDYDSGSAFPPCEKENGTTGTDGVFALFVKLIAAKSEMFYRVTSGAKSDAILSSRQMILESGESFVTQNLGYVQQLAARHPGWYTHLVTFEMQAGTRQALLSIGARNEARFLSRSGLGHLPSIEGAGPNVVHVKGELGSVNFGLRPGSLGTFNSRVNSISIEPLR